MLSITLVGDSALIAKLRIMGPNVQAALTRKVTILAALLWNLVRDDKLSGGVLNVVTGKLRASIGREITSEPTQVTAKVYASRATDYAAIHEFGGTINHPGGTAYIIDPKIGQAMFISNAAAAGKNYPRTAAHPIHMPERSFLRSSLAEMKDQIAQGMSEAVKEGLGIL